MVNKMFMLFILFEYMVLVHSFYGYSDEEHVRRFYLAAVEIEWNYAPDGLNLVTDDLSVAVTKLNNSDDRIGPIYRKVVYKQFTDERYEDEVISPSYLGYLGPILRAEIGDTLEIHFKNMASGRNYSIHPHGVLYDKTAEGALYVDGTNSTFKKDDGVPPGGSHVYIWNVTSNFGPLRSDENCVSWAYHSHVSPVKDINTGLVGCLLTCKRGVLYRNGTRSDVHDEFVIYTENVDENDSWKIQENLNICGNASRCVELFQNKDASFTQSNLMPAINGFMFGNLPGLKARDGDIIAWHFMGMNTGMRGVTINGQTFTYRQKRLNTISTFPATFVSANMRVTSPGRWLLQSRTSNEYEGGMQAFFTVTENSYRKYWRTQIDRKFFLAAEESDWDYGPTGTDTIYGTNLTADGSSSKLYFKKGPNFIGGIYKKVRYVEYTDCKFQTKKSPTSDTEHLGVLGPMLRVAVGERVQVTFRNLASRNYSFLPHGVQYDKDEEGAIYRGSPSSSAMSGKYASPGETVTYTFNVPRTVAPTYGDPVCNTYVYQSAVDPIRDVHSGLMGPLLVCKRWSLDRNGKQKHVDKEFAIFYLTIDENKSWYLDDNIRVHTGDPATVNKADPAFIASNRMHSINGRMYGNLEGLDMCIRDDVTWHVASLGDFVSMHGSYFHGNTMKIDGSNRASKVVIPGSSFTGEMIPDNAGDWQIVCRTNFHFRTGMLVQYHVRSCNGNEKDNYYDVYKRGVTRQYYIAAVQTTWDYAPGNMDLISGHNLSDPHTNGHIFVKTDDGFLGSSLEKVVYREYKDSKFSTIKTRTPEEEHLGILGPVIRAEVYDTILVTFRNMASRPYSIHAHGVLYDQSDEGILHGEPDDDAANRVNPENGDQVHPGKTYTYKWLVPRRAGPAKDYRESNCVPWIYYSGVDTIKDMNTGLVGSIVICRRGKLATNGKRRDVDREFSLLFNVMDENESWLLSENIQKYGSNETDVSDPQFRLSNQMNMVNGKIYGNLHGLQMETDEKVAWYILGLGSSFDIHTVHFHGQTFIHRDNVRHRGDVVEVFPGTYETVEMNTDNPGVWILHCHLGDHVTRGMEVTYNITERTHTGNTGYYNWLGRR